MKHKMKRILFLVEDVGEVQSKYKHAWNLFDGITKRQTKFRGSAMIDYQDASYQEYRLIISTKGAALEHALCGATLDEVVFFTLPSQEDLLVINCAKMAK